MMRYTLKKETQACQGYERNSIFCPTDKNNVNIPIDKTQMLTFEVINFNPKIRVNLFSLPDYKGNVCSNLKIN